MSNLNRLQKLESTSNESRRKRHKKPLKDYSNYSDEELNSLFENEMVKLSLEPSPYAGMTDQQLSDIYMAHIQAGNRKAKNDKKIK